MISFNAYLFLVKNGNKRRLYVSPYWKSSAEDHDLTSRNMFHEIRATSEAVYTLSINEEMILRYKLEEYKDVYMSASRAITLDDLRYLNVNIPDILHSFYSAFEFNSGLIDKIDSRVALCMFSRKNMIPFAEREYYVVLIELGDYKETLKKYCQYVTDNELRADTVETVVVDNIDIDKFNATYLSDNFKGVSEVSLETIDEVYNFNINWEEIIRRHEQGIVNRQAVMGGMVTAPPRRMGSYRDL